MRRIEMRYSRNINVIIQNATASRMFSIYYFKGAFDKRIH